MICGDGVNSSQRCESCGASYASVGGIPVFLRPEMKARARIEDAHWLNHPVEGAQMSPALALSHKRHQIRYFKETVLRRKNFSGRVLEIGAGSCWASSMIKLTRPECRVYATDISVQALLKGIKVSNLIGALPDFFATCDAQSLPFKDELFDFVLGVAALHHLDDPRVGVEEIRRVLKVRGMYIGILEGLASKPMKHLYRLVSGGISEKRRFEAEENVYSIRDWEGFFSGFSVRWFVKHDPSISVTPLQTLYYVFAKHLPDALIKQVAGTLQIFATKK